MIEARTEKVIENKTGRIDIYINTGEFVLGIENKILASDGYKQLEKYAEFLSTHKKKSLLLYLTLSGASPSKGSQGKMNSSVFPMKKTLVNGWNYVKRNQTIDLYSEKP